MANKKTMKELYGEIIANYALSKEHKEFLEGRIGVIEKKATSRSSKVNTENEALKESILDFMCEGVDYTSSDIEKGVGLSSNQKATALLRQLMESGAVGRKEIKGKAYFYKIG